MQLTGDQGLDALLNFGIRQGVSQGIKSVTAPLIAELDAALFGGPAAAAAPIAAEGGGVAFGSGLQAGSLGMDALAFGGAGEAAGAGAAAGIGIGGAMAAFGPALAFLGWAMVMDALNEPTRMRNIDGATVRWDGERFAVTRDKTVGDDGSGLLADRVADRLNTYYAAREFDPQAYLDNDPYLQRPEPGQDQNWNEPELGRIASVTRFIPDYTQPTVGHGLDVGWAGDEIAIANADDLVLSATRRVLLRAGESPESIDAFLGGGNAGAAGGLMRPQDLPKGNGESGTDGLSPAANDLIAQDTALRDQTASFTPLDAYVGPGVRPKPEAMQKRPAPPTTRDPNVPVWRDDWAYGRSRPTSKPSTVDEGTWEAWNEASPAVRAQGWRVMDVDQWRELQGLTKI